MKKKSFRELEQDRFTFGISAYIFLFFFSVINTFSSYYLTILTGGENRLGFLWMSFLYEGRYEDKIYTFSSMLEIFVLILQSSVLFILVCAPDLVANFFNKHFVQVGKLTWTNYFYTFLFSIFIITIFMILAAWRGDIGLENDYPFIQNLRDYTYVMSFFIFVLLTSISKSFEHHITKRKLEEEIAELKKENLLLKKKREI